MTCRLRDVLSSAVVRTCRCSCRLSRLLLRRGADSPVHACQSALLSRCCAQRMFPALNCTSSSTLELCTEGNRLQCSTESSSPQAEWFPLGYSIQYVILSLQLEIQTRFMPVNANDPRHYMILIENVTNLNRKPWKTTHISDWMCGLKRLGTVSRDGRKWNSSRRLRTFNSTATAEPSIR